MVLHSGEAKPVEASGNGDDSDFVKAVPVNSLESAYFHEHISYDDAPQVGADTSPLAVGDGSWRIPSAGKRTEAEVHLAWVEFQPGCEVQNRLHHHLPTPHRTLLQSDELDTKVEESFVISGPCCPQRWRRQGSRNASSSLQGVKLDLGYETGSTSSRNASRAGWRYFLHPEHADIQLRPYLCYGRGSQKGLLRSNRQANILPAVARAGLWELELPIGGCLGTRWGPPRWAQLRQV